MEPPREHDRWSGLFRRGHRGRINGRSPLLDDAAYAAYRRAIEEAASHDREVEDVTAAYARMNDPDQTPAPIAATVRHPGAVADDPGFLAIFARTLAEIGASAEIRDALLYRARICSCVCHETWVGGPLRRRRWKLGDPHDCPTGFCTHGGRLCAAEMNARLNHHASGGVAVVGGIGRTPGCCGETVSIGTGRMAGFQIEVWRCLGCGWHQSTAVRVDGQSFWVGAMGRAIGNEELRIIADSYGGLDPATSPAHRHQCPTRHAETASYLRRVR